MFYFGSMTPLKWKTSVTFSNLLQYTLKFSTELFFTTSSSPNCPFPPYSITILNDKAWRSRVSYLDFNAYHSSDPDALGLIVHSLVSNHGLEIINALSSASTRCWTLPRLPMPRAQSSSAFPYGSFLCSPWAEVLYLLTASFSPRTWETAVSQVWQCLNYGPLGADLSFSIWTP